jgi:hypothetical protein
MNMKVRAWTEGMNGKVEFAKSDSSFMPSGSYLLTHDGGKIVHLVDPAKQTYSVWDMDALFATLGQVLEGAEGVVELKFKDAESEDLGTEPGGQILGIDTTKKSWRTAYTMEMKVVFMERSQRQETTTQAWLAKGVDIPTLGIWFTVKPPTTGRPDLDLVLTESMQQIDGTPLKIVQQSKVTDKKGRGKSTNMTMEITALREEAVADNIFVMPEGYDEVPLIDLSGGDTAAKSQEGKGNPLKGLGGLFGKKKKGGG